MKFGIRTPSLKRRISARLSVKRAIRSKIRAPRGAGLITNPRKALYNKVYNRTSVSIDRLSNSIKGKSKNKPHADYYQEKFDKNSYARKVNTKGKYVCKKCGSDDWAVLTDGFLIWKTECLYCENCYKLGKTIQLNKGETKEDLIKNLTL